MFKKYIEFHKDSTQETEIKETPFKSIDPAWANTLEINNFRRYFGDFIIGLRELEPTNGFKPLTEILNPYRIKILPKSAQNRAKKAKIDIYLIEKGFGTDLIFVSFYISPEAMDWISSFIRPFDGAYKKYKIEFSKTERSLLWKLKNQPKDVHKDIREEDGVPAWENQPQQFLSESEWRFNLYLERQRKRKIQLNYIKTLKKVNDVVFWRKWERVIKLYS